DLAYQIERGFKPTPLTPKVAWRHTKYHAAMIFDYVFRVAMQHNMDYETTMKLADFIWYVYQFRGFKFKYIHFYPDRFNGILPVIDFIENVIVASADPNTWSFYLPLPKVSKKNTKKQDDDEPFWSDDEEDDIAPSFHDKRVFKSIFKNILESIYKTEK